MNRKPFVVPTLLNGPIQEDPDNPIIVGGSGQHGDDWPFQNSINPGEGDD